MKHQILGVTEDSSQLLDNLTEIKNSIYVKSDDYQFKVQIHPVIGNFAFRRENKIAENTAFETLIKLARVLDDENMSKVINALNYSIK